MSDSAEKSHGGALATNSGRSGDSGASCSTRNATFGSLRNWACALLPCRPNGGWPKPRGAWRQQLSVDCDDEKQHALNSMALRSARGKLAPDRRAEQHHVHERLVEERPVCRFVAAGCALAEPFGRVIIEHLKHAVSERAEHSLDPPAALHILKVPGAAVDHHVRPGGDVVQTDHRVGREQAADVRIWVDKHNRVRVEQHHVVAEPHKSPSVDEAQQPQPAHRVDLVVARCAREAVLHLRAVAVLALASPLCAQTGRCANESRCAIHAERLVRCRRIGRARQRTAAVAAAHRLHVSLKHGAPDHSDCGAPRRMLHKLLVIAEQDVVVEPELPWLSVESARGRAGVPLPAKAAGRAAHGYPGRGMAPRPRHWQCHAKAAQRHGKERSALRARRLASLERRCSGHATTPADFVLANHSIAV
eukprot:1278033-Prymnesium_polylepis.3